MRHSSRRAPSVLTPKASDFRKLVVALERVATQFTLPPRNIFLALRRWSRSSVLPGSESRSVRRRGLFLLHAKGRANSGAGSQTPVNRCAKHSIGLLLTHMSLNALVPTIFPQLSRASEQYRGRMLSQSNEAVFSARAGRYGPMTCAINPAAAMSLVSFVR
jgi:hypothetical protein